METLSDGLHNRQKSGQASRQYTGQAPRFTAPLLLSGYLCCNAAT
ncbi:hypothetical protein [Janthinobacterium sp. FT14W]|nr:hypothetical protein [Janthinobacterium sp. FT14W]